MNTTSFLAAILFLFGIGAGLVAILEPALGLLSIIRRYLRRILTGRTIKKDLVITDQKTQDPPMTWEDYLGPKK